MLLLTGSVADTFVEILYSDLLTPLILIGVPLDKLCGPCVVTVT